MASWIETIRQIGEKDPEGVRRAWEVAEPVVTRAAQIARALGVFCGVTAISMLLPTGLALLLKGVPTTWFGEGWPTVLRILLGTSLLVGITATFLMVAFFQSSRMEKAICGMVDEFCEALIRYQLTKIPTEQKPTARLWSTTRELYRFSRLTYDLYRLLPDSNPLKDALGAVVWLSNPAVWIGIVLVPLTALALLVGTALYLFIDLVISGSTSMPVS